MTTTTTKQPRHAAESFLPIYAATRAQHALRRQLGPIDGDAFATARKTVGIGTDIDLWELVDEQGHSRSKAPTTPITVPPLPSFEDEKRGALAGVLRRWRWRATLAKLALAEPRVEAPTSEVAR